MTRYNTPRAGVVQRRWPERGVQLLQQPAKPAEITSAARAQWRFQLGGMPSAGDQVRVDVLLASAGPNK